MTPTTLNDSDVRIYIGGRIARLKSDVVSALTHHPLSLWLDSPGYAGLLHYAPIGEYRVLLGSGSTVVLTVHLLQEITIS